MKQLARYTAVGFELAASIGVGFFGGRWLDRRLGTHWLVWLGLAIGCYAGFRALWVAARDAQAALDREDAQEGREPSGPGREDPATPTSERDGDDRPN